MRWKWRRHNNVMNTLTMNGGENWMNDILLEGLECYDYEWDAVRMNEASCWLNIPLCWHKLHFHIWMTSDQLQEFNNFCNGMKKNILLTLFRLVFNKKYKIFFYHTQLSTCICRNIYDTKRNCAGWDQADRPKRLTASAKVATVLGPIAASSDTVEYEGRQTKHSVE